MGRKDDLERGNRKVRRAECIIQETYLDRSHNVYTGCFKSPGTSLRGCIFGTNV
jgi:hypothetical protein